MIEPIQAESRPATGRPLPCIGAAKIARNAAGGVLTLADLPPARTVRWTPGRKAAVVCAVNGGLMTEAEARERYAVSPTEFAIWSGNYAADGVNALRVTRIQDRPRGGPNE